MNMYEEEVKEKWKDTEQYKDFTSKNRTKEENEKVSEELMHLFAELGNLKSESVESSVVQEKIKELQEFITDNYYTCTKEILKGLGQMYVEDQRFKQNIDKTGGEGTAEFTKKAIFVYCSK